MEKVGSPKGGDTTLRLVQMMHRLVFVLDKGADRLLRAQGRQSFSLTILLHILDTHGTRSQDVIAECLNITPPAVSRQVDTLVKAGLVTRDVVADNRRQYRIALTPAGKKEVRGSIALLEKSLAPMFECIPEPKRAAAIRVMEQALALIDEGSKCVEKRRSAAVSVKK